MNYAIAVMQWCMFEFYHKGYQEENSYLELLSGLTFAVKGNNSSLLSIVNGFCLEMG